MLTCALFVVANLLVLFCKLHFLFDCNYWGNWLHKIVNESTVDLTLSRDVVLTDVFSCCNILSVCLLL